MQPNDKELDRLIVPVHKIPKTGDIWKYVPMLDMYPEFKMPVDGVSIIAILRYIGVLYQKNSPFLTIESIAKRKIAAANWAGFKRTDKGDKFLKTYMDIIAGKNDNVNKMIVRMCRIQKNPDFQQLVIYETVLARELDSLMNMKNPDDIKKTKGNIDSFTDSINELSGKFFFGDSDTNLLESLMDEIENEQLELTPEDISIKLRARERILNYNPYDDYEPEELTVDEQKAGTRDISG